MNRINPLYSGLLLLMVLVFLSFKLHNASSELAEVKESYKDSVKLATQLSQLKKVYAKKPNLLRLRSASITQKKVKDGMIFSSSSISKKDLNSFMSKVLNKSYNITQLKIKKLSPTKASLMMEIKW